MPTVSHYDEALKGIGPPEQCPVTVHPYRCMKNRHHDDECESEDDKENIVPLGVKPVKGFYTVTV